MDLNLKKELIDLIIKTSISLGILVTICVISLWRSIKKLINIKGVENI